jgi:hypothetical protein
MNKDVLLKINLKSLRAWKHLFKNVNYSFEFKNYKRCWAHIWTPAWNEGRGPYVTIGLFYIAFFRGY